MRTTVTLQGGQSLDLRDDTLLPFQKAWQDSSGGKDVRWALAAAHVVLFPDYADVPHSVAHPGSPEEIASHIDWDATMAIRRNLSSEGFGIAEAMDTAQRFSLGWNSARRLIEECGRLAPEKGFIAGAGADHIKNVKNPEDLILGVVEQARFIQEQGGMPILLPLPWLSLNNLEEDEYVRVYREIVNELSGPIFVHWLSEAFHPHLAGYFPGESFERILALDPEKVRGCKLSLLDAHREIQIRREIHQREQIVLTGDDFHFSNLILGGNFDPSATKAAPVERWVTIGNQEVALGDFSHALLGILDAIAGPAGLALRLLSRGEDAHFRSILRPAEVLSRWIFQEPTHFYKSGLAFLSWLCGRQSNFMLINHEEDCRPRDYYLKTASLASEAGVLDDAVLAKKRLESLDWTT